MHRDVVATYVGGSIYLALARTLWGAGRTDLVLAMLSCAGLIAWPLWLPRLSLDAYLAYRDWLIVATRLMQYTVGAYLRRRWVGGGGGGGGGRW